MDKMDRREFLIRAGKVSLAAVAMLTGAPSSAAARWLDRLAPNDHERETLAAFADTLIPGAKSDPEGAPGAVEAGAVDLFYDPFYGAADMVSAFVALLDGRALLLFGRPFKDLSFARRTRVLRHLEDNPPDPLLFPLMALVPFTAFYGGATSDVGLRYIGVEGPSEGYEDASYRRPLARQRTVSGNLD